LVMSSHYLIVPTIADFFSEESLKNFGNRVVKKTEDAYENLGWMVKTEVLRECGRHFQDPDRDFPDHNPQFLGCIISRYQITKKGSFENGLIHETTAHNVEFWRSRVEKAASDLGKQLAQEKSHFPESLALERKTFRACRRTPYILARINDFHQLAYLATYVSKPVHFLIEDDLRYLGTNKKFHSQGKPNYLEKIRHFGQVMNNCIDTILKLTFRGGRKQIPPARDDLPSIDLGELENINSDEKENEEPEEEKQAERDEVGEETKEENKEDVENEEIVVVKTQSQKKGNRRSKRKARTKKSEKEKKAKKGEKAKKPPPKKRSKRNKEKGLNHGNFSSLVSAESYD